MTSAATFTVRVVAVLRAVRRRCAIELLPLTCVVLALTTPSAVVNAHMGGSEVRGFVVDSVPAGLLGYWALDDGTGTTATDSSGNDRTGTLTNGPIWTTGIIGPSALSCDGADDYVAIPVV